MVCSGLTLKSLPKYQIVVVEVTLEGFSSVLILCWYPILYEHCLWTFYQVQKMVDTQWTGIVRGDVQDVVTLVCFLFGSLESAGTQSTCSNLFPFEHSHLYLKRKKKKNNIQAFSTPNMSNIQGFLRTFVASFKCRTIWTELVRSQNIFTVGTERKESWFPDIRFLWKQTPIAQNKPPQQRGQPKWSF